MTTPATSFMEQAAPFFVALHEWERDLPVLSWEDLRAEAERTALFSIDMVNGFCHEGPLSSPRVEGIIPAVVAACEGAYAIGVRNFVLAQDCHTPDAAEFASFPPHCQCGSSEAETIPELARLPFADLYTIVQKNSLNAFYGTNLGSWLGERPQLRTVIVVGNCTDLCVHQAALYLKLNANAADRPLRVIVPANAIQTYDTPVDVARQIGAPPHSGAVFHLTFLYHMYLNGIEVVREIR